MINCNRRIIKQIEDLATENEILKRENKEIRQENRELRQKIDKLEKSIEAKPKNLDALVKDGKAQKRVVDCTGGSQKYISKWKIDLETIVDSK